MHDQPLISGSDITTTQHHFCSTPMYRSKPQAVRGENTVELCAPQCEQCGSFKATKLTHSWLKAWDDTMHGRDLIRRFSGHG
jgi:hypothetical protein